MQTGRNEIDDMIVHEKMQVALEYQNEAWADGMADGIAAPQGYDKNGPTGVITSVAAIKQTDFPNGTLMNLKFHPTALAGEGGWKKLMQLMQTYFDMGGMELQVNVISTDTLKDAQKNPDKHKNLVVRVAGFSAYFVELHPTGQNDLIRRTELAM